MPTPTTTPMTTFVIAIGAFWDTPNEPKTLTLYKSKSVLNKSSIKVDIYSTMNADGHVESQVHK